MSLLFDDFSPKFNSVLQIREREKNNIFKYYEIIIIIFLLAIIHILLIVIKKHISFLNYSSSVAKKHISFLICISLCQL